jgi:hypothetical protein
MNLYKKKYAFLGLILLIVGFFITMGLAGANMDNIENGLNKFNEDIGFFCLGLFSFGLGTILVSRSSLSSKKLIIFVESLISVIGGLAILVAIFDLNVKLDTEVFIPLVILYCLFSGTSALYFSNFSPPAKKTVIFFTAFWFLLLICSFGNLRNGESDFFVKFAILFFWNLLLSIALFCFSRKKIMSTT